MTCDMRLARVVGLPAVMGEKLVGHVERAVLDGAAHHLRGLVIRRGLGSAKWVDCGAIRVLGDVSVVLDARPVRLPKEADATFSIVQDESGLMLGRVTDAWVSADTLDITALEVTLGLVEDLRYGRCIVREWAVGKEGQVILLVGRQRTKPPS